MLPKKEYTVTNIVVSAKALGYIPLNDITRTLRAGYYMPKSFSAVVLHFTNPEASVNMFTNGTMTMMGAKHVHDVYVIFNYLKRKLGLTIVNISIRNIMAKSSYDHKIDLVKFNKSNRGKTMSDLDLFPDVTYKPRPEEKKAINVFASGRFVVAGSKTLGEIETEVVKMCKLLDDFKD